MNLTDAIAVFFDSPAGQAALAVLAVGGLDFALDLLADWRDKKLELDRIADWIRTDLAGKIIPIWLLLFIGYYAQGIQFADIPLILAAGLGAAGLYVAETVASVLMRWGRKQPDEPDKEEAE